MASVKLYLDCRYKKKDGTGRLVMVLSHHGVAVIPLGVNLKPSEWDGKKVVRHPNAKELNAVITKKKCDLDAKLAILSLRSDFHQISAKDLYHEMLVEPIERKKKKLKVADIFDEYMKSDMQDGTREIYKLTKKKVLDFGGDNLRINDINLAWLNRFEKYLAETQTVNGRAMYLRDLRTICNYAKNNEYTKNYPFSNFKIKTEQTVKRDIKVDSLRKLYTVPIPENLVKYRDIFFLMFYLVGINITDLLKAKPSDIVDGRLVYIRKKTHKKYSIKIEPEAERLLKKYKGRKYLIDIMDHRKTFKSFMHEMNDGLKQIGEVTWDVKPDDDKPYKKPDLEKKFVPIIPGLTTYYARHTWASLAFNLGISSDIVSQALGHSFGNSTTMRYIDFDPLNVDAANRRVIDYFEEGLVTG